MVAGAIGQRPGSAVIVFKLEPCVAESHHSRCSLRSPAYSRFWVAPQRGTVSAAGLSGAERDDGASRAADGRQYAREHGFGSAPGKTVSVPIRGTRSLAARASQTGRLHDSPRLQSVAKMQGDRLLTGRSGRSQQDGRLESSAPWDNRISHACAADEGRSSLAE